MKTVVVDKKDVVIRIETNALKIEQQSIPFKYIDLLVLNHRIQLSTSDILKLTKENISILIISHSNDNLSLVASANTKNAQIKLAQYNAYKNHIKFAKHFISNKIEYHAQQIKHNDLFLDAQTELLSIQNATTIDEILGIEGSFAKKYFKEFFTLFAANLHKSKRSKQPPLDPVNAVLSYWYSLFYKIITVKLISYGFEPSIGFLHKPFREHNALSSDILELFRADINEAVIQLFQNKILEIEDFSKKGGVYLKYDGRKKIWGEFLALVDVLKPKLDLQLAQLKKMIEDESNNNY